MDKRAILGLALTMVATPALADYDHRAGAPAVIAATPLPNMPPMMRQDMPPMASGRWPGGDNAPGGWNAYQRPGYGYQLPGYWMASPFFISDYRAYGFDAPSSGFGWSRYYDDAVLTDQWGRVYDSRSNVNWDRPGDAHYDDHDHHHGKFTDGVLGGVVGAGLGAGAGYAIGGVGSRLAGSLIGGGVGALAGVALELALSKHHHRSHDTGYDDRDYRGERAMAPHWGGYPAYGYNGGGGGDTIVVVTGDAPTMHTVTRTYTDVVYRTVRRAAPKRHYYKPRPACPIQGS